MQPIVLLE
ncbi:unnamed protein product, partial [Didymodactylos carnosus]